jgi:hypothetical protein
MINHNDWFEDLKQDLDADLAKNSDVHFDRLVALGIINDRGEVTGHLHRWDAFLAITEVKRSTDPKRIGEFRCLKPVFGMPGGATIDVRRESMVDYLKQGKKVITAIRDHRLDMWKEGPEVHLTANGFVRCSGGEDIADDVGSLPDFPQSNSKF